VALLGRHLEVVRGLARVGGQILGAFQLPGPFSLDYVYNPYLGFGTPDRSLTASPAAPVETAAAPTPAPAAPAARPADVRPVAAGQSVFDKHIELLRLGGFQF
jgi:hypothetical protein